MKPFNSLYASLGLTIFEEMSSLARQHDAINLGQGFPDEDEPRAILDAASRAIYEHKNQYPPMRGLPELRKAVAAHDARFYGVSVDADREVLVTSGATEALAATFLALIEAGDEVVVLDPAYDSYVPMIKRSGGIPRVVAMRPPSWTWDEAELRAAFSPKTKAVVVNSPMNPTGRVLSRDEMSVLVELARRHDTYIVSDEVYEHITFAPHRHISMLELARERTIKLGSAGKTFALTGFKVGYLTSTPELISIIASAHQFLTFTTPPNLQRAIADGLGQPDASYAALADDLRGKRDRLVSGLRDLGFDVTPSEGTYFVVANVGGDDRAYCKRLVTEKRVAAIPVSALGAAFPAHGYIRFCFAKRDEVLDEALRRLSR